MQRRDFLTVLGGAAATWPLAVRAQQSQIPVIGWLNGASQSTFARQVAGFQQGLGDAGYVEGRNVAIEYRWADGQYEKIPAMAADLVHRQVAVMAAIGAPAVVPAKAATATIPIIFYLGEDPVELGLVPSFSRPGGNLTGVANLSLTLLGKRLELLRELTPRTAAISVLVNPKNPNVEINIENAQEAARTLHQQIAIVNASSTSDLEAVFEALSRRPGAALLIGADNVFNAQLAEIAALATRFRIPTSHFLRTFPEAGGLMSYGASQIEGLRLAGTYVGRVLKGARPADLPVVQPTKFELVINLKTARLLGLTVPPSLLATADDVIE